MTRHDAKPHLVALSTGGAICRYCGLLVSREHYAKVRAAWEKQHGHLGCPVWGWTQREIRKQMIARKPERAGEPVVR